MNEKTARILRKFAKQAGKPKNVFFRDYLGNNWKQRTTLRAMIKDRIAYNEETEKTQETETETAT